MASNLHLPPLTLKQLKEYRAFAFPLSLAKKGHDPYFSLENLCDWVQPDAVTQFLSANPVAGIASSSSDEDSPWETATMQTLRAYRSFLLPPEIAKHDFFELDNAKNWTRRAATHPLIKTEPHIKIEPHTSIIKTEPKLSTLGKRKACSFPDDVIEISDSESDIEAPKKIGGTRAIIDLTGSDVEVQDPQLPHGKKSKKPRREATQRIIVPGEDIIKITRKDSVSKVVNLDGIPAGWDIPDVPTAFILDLTDNPSLADRNIISLIRHEDQCSWSGSGGHAKGDASVNAGILSDEKVLCQRADFTCNGIKHCQFFDTSNLEGYESLKRDKSDMQVFWTAELDANEEEFRDPNGPVARFWRRCQETLCNIPCKGSPVLRKLNKTTFHGKNYFVGCSEWRPGDKGVHRSIQIDDRKINEDQLVHLFANGGKFKDQPCPQKACNIILSPRSHKETCSFTHITEDGQISTGRIVSRACTSRLTVFMSLVPGINKAVVIPRGAHNHPQHMSVKPTLKEKKLVEDIYKATNKTRVTVKGLQTSALASALLEGETWDSVLPGFVDDKRLRKYVKSLNSLGHPMGLDFPGVQYEASTREIKSPLNERYIHSVITKGDIQVVVTMLPKLVKHIHDVRFLAIDYTFKRVHGSFNEWEIASTIDRYKTRVTLASLYCNRATREAFRILFTEFFDAIERVTGRPLQFWFFNRNARLRNMLFDAEAAQMGGLGDVILSLNNPEITQVTTEDPLVIVQHVSKTCVNHFTRNIDELPKNIPRDVIDRLKSFPSLSNAEDIDAWRIFCRDSPYPAVVNWYKQKTNYAWYLPSVNSFLSPMHPDSWRITPDDTNIAETAHAARNAETGIGMPLLAAILDAKTRDNAIAERLDRFETDGQLANRWNGAQEREKRSASRREANRVKATTIGAHRARFDTIIQERAHLAKQRADSLTRNKEIRTRLDSIKIDLKTCSSISTTATDLKDERQLLNDEHAAAVAQRKVWSAEDAALTKELDELKKNELKNVRVRDSRSASANVTPFTSPTKKNHYSHPGTLPRTPSRNNSNVPCELMLPTPIRELQHWQDQDNDPDLEATQRPLPALNLTQGAQLTTSEDDDNDLNGSIDYEWQDSEVPLPDSTLEVDSLFSKDPQPTPQSSPPWGRDLDSMFDSFASAYGTYSQPKNT